MSDGRVSLPSEDDGPIVRSLGGSLFEVEVTEQNRINFFQEAVDNLDGNRGEAEIILRNLKKWSPELAESFKIRDGATVLSNPFRLICESDLGAVPFDSENVIRQFLAVSYCWRHDDDDWPGNGSLPHAPWPFSQPFVEALLAERGVHTNSPERHPSYRREGIWVDQMCIRQDDENEKLKSIAMMDMIYDKCRKLIILLEDVTFTLDEIMVIEKYNNPEPKTVEDCIWKPDSEDLSPIASLCGKVENSRWWSRAWCWHELEVNKPWSDMRHHYYAHNATFIVRKASSGDQVGTYSFKYLTLWYARMSSLHLANSGKHQFSLPKALRWSMGENKTSAYLDPPNRGQGVVRSSLMARYFVATDTECTIPSDMISIIINLAGLGIYLDQKFKEYHQVFFVTTVLALACGEKRPLTWMHNKSLDYVTKTSPENGSSGDDSWLSKPSGGIDTDLPRFTVGGVQGVQRITQNQIELDLIFLETSVEQIIDQEVAATYEIFPEKPIRSRKVAFQDKRIPTDEGVKADEDDETYDAMRRKFLLASCKDGLVGIRRLWNLLDKEVVQPSFNNRRFEPFGITEALRPAARKLLDWLSSSEAGDTASTSQICAEDENVVLLFLTFITDPRALYLITPKPASIQYGSKEHAIIGPPVVRHPVDYSIQRRCQLAIPTDLVDYPSNVLRVWFLLPVEKSAGDVAQEHPGSYEGTNGRWRLVGKSMLLGEPRNVLPIDDTFNTRNQLLTLRKRQIVQG